MDLVESNDLQLKDSIPPSPPVLEKDKDSGIDNGMYTFLKLNDA